MHCTLRINNEALDYRLVRSNRKTIAVTIARDRTVTVKAPRRASELFIETLLKEKWSWIDQTRDRLAEMKPIVQQEYTNGAPFRYLGVDYYLSIQLADPREHISIDGNTLRVDSHFPSTPLHTKNQLECWLTAQAECYFIKRLAVCSQRLGIIDAPALAIRRMKTRWGSYSRKTHRVCLNHRLILANTEQIDFVIIHELCHIQHMAHDAAFYRLLTQRLPNWKQLKHDLEHNVQTT